MPLTPIEKKARVLLLASELPPGLVVSHLRHLDSDYFNEFSPDEILEHLKTIKQLGETGDFNFYFKQLDELHYEMTIIGIDLPGFFAVLTGVVASYDLDIRLGKVFTYTADHGPEATSESVNSGRIRIIDYLVLQLPVSGFLSDSIRANIIADLELLINLLKGRKTQELRMDLYRRIGGYLSRSAFKEETTRLPLEIQYGHDDQQTLIKISGTDHKALLFSLSNALMLQGVSIQKLITKSESERFEDRIFVTDSLGHPITNIQLLERLKVAVILMERFTSTLPQASDYSAAVHTFNEFINALMDNSAVQPDLATFEDFSVLSTLAKILSAGPYLWEELIKIPWPDLTQLLRAMEDGDKISAKSELENRLFLEMAKSPTYSEKISALNRFKDRQLFRMDVENLIHPHRTLQEFSRALSQLADIVLECALGMAYDRLRSQYGEPAARTPEVTGPTRCHYGLFAQGKLGGQELGYASDLELQLVYGNSGETRGGEQSISHSEFFSLVVQEIRSIIAAKKEGIFELDLRLRPHGDSGPLATSIDSWVEYYGEEGGAMDFERQALLKLRPVAATPGFADRVMAARDAVVFGETPVEIEKTLLLRAQQVAIKGKSPNLETGVINAKYSPGGLVEVEYSVQFLQLQHGRRLSSLREANTEKALEVLLAEGILQPGEFEKLYRGYVLLRRLINSLRMVRGHSRDLWVPAPGTPDFLALAKRMGYLPTTRFQPDSQLEWDLTHSLQNIHSVFAVRFQASQESVPPSPSLTALFLNPASTQAELKMALERLGVNALSDAKILVDELFKNVHDKGLLCAALVVSEARLRTSPDPEAVLKHLGQFLEAVPDADYFIRQILNHPHLQDILIKAFGHSEYLTQILLQQPEYLLALGNPSTLEKPKLWAEYQSEISSSIQLPPGEQKDRSRAMEAKNPIKPLLPLDAAMDSLRRYRNREYLRIGLRDIFLNVHLRNITAEISQLTNALVQSIFDLTMEKAGTAHLAHAISVIALGKLGGNELNYSSDIDIVFVIDAERLNDSEQLALDEWARVFVKAASEPGFHGKLFRIDAQLRPYGGQSPLLGSEKYYREYYRQFAAGWELQAWLKARPLAGNSTMGNQLIKFIHDLAVFPNNRAKIAESMQEIRKLGLEKLRQEDRLFTEVKLGPGGIRTIEFYAQYQQILHGQAHPELISGNTLTVLGKLYRYRLITQNYYDILSKSYIFLRRIEHVLQLQGLQQRHELPTSQEEMERLSKRMGFEDRAGQSASSQFRAKYRQHMLPLLEISSTLFGYETNVPSGTKEKK